MIILMKIQINQRGMYIGAGMGIINSLVSEYYFSGTETKAWRILVDFLRLYSNC